MTLLAQTSILGTNPILLQGEFLGHPYAITLSQVIYWGIAAIIGIIAETVVGWRLPFGIIGAIAASLLGIWLLTDVIPLNITGDITIAGQPIPLIKALLGALLVVSLWHLITFPFWRGREHYIQRRRRGYNRNRDYSYRGDY